MRFRHCIIAILSLSALLAPAFAAAEDVRLAELVKAQGVSGFERDVRDRIAGLLPSWAKPKVDEAGNLVLTIGQGQPHLLVVTSIDEDGYLVSGITDDGFLRLTQGVDGRQLPAVRSVRLRTAGRHQDGGRRRGAGPRCPRRVRHGVEPPAARPRRVDGHQGPRRHLRRRRRGHEGRRRGARHPPARHGRPPRTRSDARRRTDGGRRGAGSSERPGARQARSRTRGRRNRR